MMTERLCFVIYSRSYCHLCEDLKFALLAALEGMTCHIEMVDVDADPALLARYDELVPVLMGTCRDGLLVEICHYHLDEAALRRFLSASGVDFLS